MRNLFRSKPRITQEFGVNPTYYKKFGLDGHEGIDAVPTGSVWDVLALEDGVVVRDVDDAVLGKNYGKNVTLWHPTVQKATQYCHLESNIVKMGERVTKGQVIGKMGNTGNTTGAHVHLNLFAVDENGVRLNRDNGFFGGINPAAFMNEPEDAVHSSLQADLDACRIHRDSHWNDLQEIKENLDVTGDYSKEIILKRIDALKSTEHEFASKDKQLLDAIVEANMLRGQVKEEKEKNEQFAIEASTLARKAEELENKYQKAIITNERHLEKIAQLQHDLSTPDDAWTLIRKGVNKLLGR